MDFPEPSVPVKTVSGVIESITIFQSTKIFDLNLSEHTYLILNLNDIIYMNVHIQINEQITVTGFNGTKGFRVENIAEKSCRR